MAIKPKVKPNFVDQTVRHDDLAGRRQHISDMEKKLYTYEEKAMRQRRVRDAAEEDSFHRAVGPILQTAQLFGVLPVSEIFATNVRDVKFRWMRFKVLLSMLAILGAFIETSLQLLQGFRVGIDMDVAAGIFFLASILLGMILLLGIARKWPQLIRLWHRTELVFLRSPYYVRGITLKWRLRLVGFTMLVFALIEHLLYIASTVYFAYKHIEKCKMEDNYFVYAFLSERMHFFEVITFRMWLIIPLEFLNISMTFCWSFVDVLLSIVSIGLATRFNQINDRLKAARGKLMPESYWIEMRCHYLIMTELLRYIDEQLSFLILLSCANNLFYICFLFFNNLDQMPYVVTTVYHWLALIFIIGRTLTMLFCAASVHDAALKPLAVLRNVPCKAWSIEVRRFSDFINHEMVALSGKRFFFLTRKLILAMAGTVATYELVLLDQVDLEPFKESKCEL